MQLPTIYSIPYERSLTERLIVSLKHPLGFVASELQPRALLYVCFGDFGRGNSLHSFQPTAPLGIGSSPVSTTANGVCLLQCKTCKHFKTIWGIGFGLIDKTCFRGLVLKLLAM